MNELARGYVELQRRLFELYFRSDFQGALEVVEDGARHLDTPWTRVAWWRACLLSRLGRTAEALDALAAAVEAGAWWSVSMLEREMDFDPIRHLPGFASIVEVCEGRHKGFGRSIPGLLVESPPFRSPLLCVLHGRAELFEATVGTWATAALTARWAVAFPESSQRESIDGPAWDDAAVAAKEVTALLDALQDDPSVDVGRCSLAGYSQGGRRALQLAIDAGARFRGVIALCPTVLRHQDVSEVLSAIGDPPWPAVVIITGERDPAFEGQQMLTEQLEAEGLRVRFDSVPGTGHQAPEDFPTRLSAALQFVEE